MSIIVGAASKIEEANTAGRSRVRLVSRLLSDPIWPGQYSREGVEATVKAPVSEFVPADCHLAIWSVASHWSHLYCAYRLTILMGCCGKRLHVLRYVTKPEYTVEAVGNQSKAGLTFIVYHAKLLRLSRNDLFGHHDHELAGGKELVHVDVCHGYLLQGSTLP